MQPPKTCFAFGTDRSLLCIVFLRCWLPQGQSSSLVLQHKGTECRHLSFQQSTSSAFIVFQLSQQMFLWHPTLLPFSNNEQKEKNYKCQMWKNLHCNVHGLKIWWMYFFKCLSKKSLSFLFKGFSTKPFCLFANISECGRFFSFVLWNERTNSVPLIQVGRSCMLGRKVHSLMQTWISVLYSKKDSVSKI